MWKFLFSPNGRVSRKGLWQFIIVYIVIYFGATGADMATGLYDSENDIGIISGLISLFLLWPSLAVTIKRFHDRNMSGWWVLWFLLLTFLPLFLLFGIPASGVLFGENGPSILAWLMMGTAAIIQVVQYIILLTLPGTRGENKYGPDPLEKS